MMYSILETKEIGTFYISFNIAYICGQNYDPGIIETTLENIIAKVLFNQIHPVYFQQLPKLYRPISTSETHEWRLLY